MELLLAAKADCDVQNSNGNTPLHLAAGKGWIQVAELLAGAGADPHIRNSKGWLAIQVRRRVRPRPRLARCVVTRRLQQRPRQTARRLCPLSQCRQLRPVLDGQPPANYCSAPAVDSTAPPASPVPSPATVCLQQRLL